MYLYRFLNKHHKIIYIGRTNNLIRRLRNEHFTQRGHLPESCYNETVAVEWAAVTSTNEAKMYELYYIEQHHPKYNQSDIGGGAFSFELQELDWQPFEFNTDTHTKTKQEIITLVAQFNDELNTECLHAGELLRNKDQLSWLEKLSQDERNEYLRVIYTLERFVQNVADRNTEMIKQVN